MDVLTILFIAVGLAMDALAVSLGIGTTRYGNGNGQLFRLSFHFGLFQAIMPIIGWLGGLTVQSYIADIDHWVAFGLLAFVGGRMVRSGLDPNGEAHNGDPTRGSALILLSIAVSIDALAVGLSLAVMRISILYPALIIGFVTGGLSLVGLRMGERLGKLFGKRMEIIGGVILIAIGLRVLMIHLFA